MPWWAVTPPKETVVNKNSWRDLLKYPMCDVGGKVAVSRLGPEMMMEKSIFELFSCGKFLNKCYFNAKLFYHFFGLGVMGLMS